MSAIQRRDKLYKKFKHSGLETDKDNSKVAKMHMQKMILKKKKSDFKEELDKNKSKPKELWKTLKSLGLSSDKARQSNISLKKDGASFEIYNKFINKIINLSRGVLKPILKKGARTDSPNYRPIIFLPLVSKIIEKSIHFQIEDYLN